MTSENVEFVPTTRVASLMKRLKLDLGRADDRRQLALELGTVGLLHTKLGRARRRHTLSLQLRSAGTDRIIKRQTLKAKKRSRLRYLTGQRVAPWAAKVASKLAPALPPTRIAMLDITGSARTQIEPSVMRALNSQVGLTFVSSDGVQEAGDAVTGGLYEASGRAEVAKSLNLQYYLRLRLKKPSSYTARLEILDGPTGHLLQTLQVESRRSVTLGARLRHALADFIVDRNPKPTPQPEPAEAPTSTPEPGLASPEPTQTAEPEVATIEPDPNPEVAQTPAEPTPAQPEVVVKTEPKKQPIPSVTPDVGPQNATRTARVSPASTERALNLAAGLGVMTRHLDYTDDLFDELRPYSLNGAATVNAAATWYPAAGSKHQAARAFGLEGHLSLGVGLGSKDSSDRSYSTQALAYDLSARVRLPLGGHELGMAVGGGQHRFSLQASDDGTTSPVPSVQYSFLRVGIDAQIALTPSLQLRPRIGWRQVLDAGDISSDAWFPRASIQAMDAEFTVVYRLLPSLELQTGVQLQRYAYDFGAKPEDTLVAGGAVDQYLSGQLLAVWHFDADAK